MTELVIGVVAVGVIALAPAGLGAGLVLILFRRSPRRRHGPPWDVIIVPGSKVCDDGSASPSFTRRVTAACALIEQGHAERVIISGKGPGPRTEADVGAELAARLGVAEHRIEREDQAARTAQNAAFTADLAADCRVLVVTEDWHAPRSRLWFGRYHDKVDVHGVRSPARSWWKQAPREVVKVAWQAVSRRA